MFRFLVPLFFLLLSLPGSAAELSPAARRGEAFYHHPFRVSERLPACASCHGDDPLQGGKHVVTGKAIKPLAPAANAERFSDPAKVEKWFGRNCREVVGRECTPAEKGDFIAYLREVR